MHNLYPLVLAVTCMEQLNTQKLMEGKHESLLLEFLLLFFGAASSGHSQTLPQALFLFLFCQFHPPGNRMHDWEGTRSAWRGKRGEEGKEMDTPLVSLLSFPGPSA